MSNCRGCGTVLDPTESEVNQGVNEILEASLKDAVKHAEICPPAAIRKRNRSLIASRYNLDCCWPLCCLALCWPSLTGYTGIPKAGCRSRSAEAGRV